jgi:hypothetical protein
MDRYVFSHVVDSVPLWLNRFSLKSLPLLRIGFKRPAGLVPSLSPARERRGSQFNQRVLRPAIG